MAGWSESFLGGKSSEIRDEHSNNRARITCQYYSQTGLALSLGLAPAIVSPFEKTEGQRLSGDRVRSSWVFIMPLPLSHELENRSIRNNHEKMVQAKSQQ